MYTVFLMWLPLFLLLSIFFSAFPLVSVSILLIGSCVEIFWVELVPGGMLYIHCAFLVGGFFRYLINPAEFHSDNFLPHLIILASLAGLSCIFSLNPLLAATFTLKFSIILSVFYIAYLYSKIKFSVAQSQTILQFVLSISLVIALFQTIDPLGNDLAIQAGFHRPEVLAFFLLWVLPFLIHTVCQKAKIKKRKQDFFLFLLVVAIVLMAESRAASTIALLVVIASLFTNYFPQPEKKWLTRFAVIFALIAIIDIVWDSDSISIQIYQWFASARLQDYLQDHFLSLYAFKHNPLQGVGLGQLNPYLIWSGFENAGGMTSSSLFILLGEVGLLGTVPFLLLIYAMLEQFNNSRYITGQFNPVKFSGNLVLFTPFIINIHNETIFWMVLAVLLGQASSNKKQENFNEEQTH